MPAKFIDVLGGNDANDGSTYANRVKTPQLGILAGRTAAGDVWRWPKSSDPISAGVTSAWTKGSRLITLSAPLGGTKNIFRGETNFTVASGVTAVAGTNQFRGDSIRGSGITIAAGATTGKVAYAAVEGGPLDLTGYTRISFFCLLNATTLTANNLSIKLCSDTTGDTPVATAFIPAITVATRWFCFTLDLTGTLGAGIQSIAIYMDVDVAPAQPLYFDQIIACKPAGTAGAIDYHTLIGKQSEPESIEWYRIEGFYADMQTIVLGIGSGSQSNPSALQQRSYYGENYSGTLYQRGTIVIPSSQGIPTSTNVTNFSFVVSGNSSAHILMSGGWDPADSMQTQNGQTIFSSEHCDGGYLFTFSSLSYLRFDRIGASGFSQTWRPTSCSDFVWDTLGINSGTSTVITFATLATRMTINSLGFCGMSLGTALAFSSMIRSKVYSSPGDIVRSCGGNTAACTINSCYDSLFDMRDVSFDNNYNAGITLTNSVRCDVYHGGCVSNTIYGIELTSFNAYNNIFCFGPISGNSQGIYFAAQTLETKVYYPTTSSNTTPINYQSYGLNYLHFPMIQEVGAEVSGFTSNFGGRLLSVGHDATEGNYVDFAGYQQTVSDPSVLYDGASRTLKSSPTSATECDECRPCRPFNWEFSLVEGFEYTFTVWARRDNSGITARLVLPGNQLDGLPTTDQYADLVAVGEWAAVTIGPFTPTATGVIYLKGIAFGGATYNAWFSKIEHTKTPI